MTAAEYIRRILCVACKRAIGHYQAGDGRVFCTGCVARAVALSGAKKQ